MSGVLWRHLLSSIGSLSDDDGNASEKVTQKKEIHAVLNFIAFHLSNVGDILRSRNSEATVSKFTKRKKKILVLRSSPPNLVLHKSNFVPSVLSYAPYGANPGNEVAINRESRHFHVVVVHLLLPFPLPSSSLLKNSLWGAGKILVRAAKIIFGLDWCTSSDKELACHANWFLSNNLCMIWNYSY